MSNILRGILYEASRSELEANIKWARGGAEHEPKKYTIVDGTGKYIGDIYDSYVEAEQALPRYAKKVALAKIVALPAKPKALEEDLRKWFKEKWVRFGPDGKIRGDCARGSESEGKPKCLPQAKAHALGKKGRKYAASKKRREDPDADRSGPAKNVATKKKSNEGVAEGLVGDVVVHNYTKMPIELKPGQAQIHGWGPNDEPIYRVKGHDGKEIITSNKKKMMMVAQGQGVAEEQLDELKCWPGYTRVQGVPAGAPGSCKKKTNEEHQQCPECGGPMFSEELINEKKDACYYKVKSRYKVWPSAYASGALVKCRKKGAKNWGTKSESAIMRGIQNEQNTEESTMMTTKNVDTSKIVPGATINHGFLGQLKVVKIEGTTVVAKDPRGKEYRISLTSVK